MNSKYLFINLRRVGVFQLLFLMIVINYSFSQNSKVGWSSFNMGFAESKSSNTVVKSVVGQNFVGTSQQANVQILSGFLADSLFRSFLVAVKEDEGIPATYSLEQNYPNPFNPVTTIIYQLPEQGHATLKVFDILGREVVTLVDEKREAGRYEVKFGGSGIPSGIYFYRFQAGTFTETKKLILLK
jgi:hypothetical protein